MTLYYYGVPAAYGGMENFAKNLLTDLAKRKKDVNIVIIAEQDDISFRELYDELNIKIIVLPKWKRHPFRFYKQLLSLLKTADKHDVLQINTCSYRNYFLFKAAKKSGIKTIIVGHYTTVNAWNFGFIHYLNRFIFRKFGTQVSITEDVRKFMFHKKSHPITIMNGIDTYKFTYSPERAATFKKEHNLMNKIVIGQVGRLSDDKNQMFSLKVMQKIHERRNDVILILVGMVLDDKIIKYINDNNLNSFVVHEGLVSQNIESYYDGFDISLLPSKNEGLSLSLLENAANGIKLFASDRVPSLNLDSTNITYLPLDVNLWVSEILKYIEEGIPKTRTNYLLGTYYDLEVQTDSYYNLYKRLSKID